MKNRKVHFKTISVSSLVIMLLLVVVLFEKNNIIQKSMGVPQTKTIACTSSNYSMRESDDVCENGYVNVGNDCTETPSYEYTCPNGGTLIENEKCKYEAVKKYTCTSSPSAMGSCLCVVTYENPNGLGATDTRTVSCGSYSSCSSACKSLIGQNAVATSISTTPIDSCAIGSPNCFGSASGATCSNGGCYSAISNKCYIYSAKSCPSGYNISKTEYSCPNGGESDNDGSCIYDATKTQSGSTYTGNINCELNIDTSNFLVQYDGNGGSGTTDSHVCEIDGECELKPNGFTREGYVFIGWKQENSGDLIQPGTSIKNVITSGVITYYAQWERESIVEEYKCYVCGSNSNKTYTWTNEDKSNDSTCVVDENKNSSSKCKEDFVNPSTGLLNVGSILINLLVIVSVLYIIIKKKQIFNNY